MSILLKAVHVVHIYKSMGFIYSNNFTNVKYFCDWTHQLYAGTILSVSAWKHNHERNIPLIHRSQKIMIYCNRTVINTITQLTIAIEYLAFYKKFSEVHVAYKLPVIMTFIWKQIQCILKVFNSMYAAHNLQAFTLEAKFSLTYYSQYACMHAKHIWPIAFRVLDCLQCVSEMHACETQAM